MSGRKAGDFTPLSLLFKNQAEFQKKVTKLEPPADDVYWFQYHISAMMEELGELLKADKRWKTHRNANYDPENKLEEMADVFITAINLAIFSGFTAHEVYGAIVEKILQNEEKLKRGNTDEK